MSRRLGSVSPSGTGASSASPTITGTATIANLVVTGTSDERGLIASTTGITKVGTTATTSHSLTTGDVITGGALEVDGATFCDGALTVAGATSVAAVTASGVFITAAGSASAPAVALNNGSNNTGIHFGSTRVNFAVGGANSAFVDGNGINAPANFDIIYSSANLTAGSLNSTRQSRMETVWHRYDWTNAMVVALGGVTAGDVAAFTIPAKHVVTNAYVVITGTAAGVTTLTVAFGRTSASYIDYIVASDAKAATSTVYGDTSAERGTNLTGYDIPSWTGTTVCNLHFISTGANLSAVTGSTGSVYIQTEPLSGL